LPVAVSYCKVGGASALIKRQLVEQLVPVLVELRRLLAEVRLLTFAAGWSVE
jgi:hypothetical protein